MDPFGLIDEIHEDNNKGWAQFGYSCNQPGSVSETTGIEEEEKTQSYLNIYPIPADEQMIIEHDLSRYKSTSAIISIYNLMGKEVIQFDVSVNYEGRIYWNTRSVSPGVYIVKLISESGTLETKKVIIAR